MDVLLERSSTPSPSRAPMRFMETLIGSYVTRGGTPRTILILRLPLSRRSIETNSACLGEPQSGRIRLLSSLIMKGSVRPRASLSAILYLHPQHATAYLTSQCHLNSPQGASRP